MYRGKLVTPEVQKESRKLFRKRLECLQFMNEDGILSHAMKNIFESKLDATGRHDDTKYKYFLNYFKERSKKKETRRWYTNCIAMYLLTYYLDIKKIKPSTIQEFCEFFIQEFSPEDSPKESEEGTNYIYDSILKKSRKMFKLIDGKPFHLTSYIEIITKPTEERKLSDRLKFTLE